ncbi:MAG: Ig-like domain-containing protein [Eubacteriales bacterium]|nr:Ig-like domain-containing protein [Eubacteriales bacterium]
MKHIVKIQIYALVLCLFIGIFPFEAFAAANFGYYSSNPKNNAKDVNPNLDEITITFSYEIDWSGQGFQDEVILMSREGKVVPTRADISGKNLVVTIDKALESYTTYTLSVPAGILKKAGGDLSTGVNTPITIQFTTKKTTFSYSSTTPRNRATNVSYTTQYVTISFHDNVSIRDEALFDTIAVKDQLNKIVSDSCVAVNNYIRLKVAGNLQPYKTYMVEIPEGAISAPGKGSDSSYEFYNEHISIWFTTETDRTALTLLNYSSGSRVIDPNATIVLKFNKPIYLGEGANQISLKTTNGQEVPILLTISPSEDELLVEPKNILSNKTTYKLYLPRNAVHDSSLNNLRSNYTLTYTTGINLDPPMMVTSDIVDGDTDIPIGKDEICITFDKNIKYSTRYADIKLEGLGKIIGIKKTISDNVLKIGINNVLEAGTNYTLTIPAQSIKDLENKDLNEEIVINFTTKFANPNTKTQVIQKSTQISDVEIPAGTEFEDVIYYILPKQVEVTLSDKTTEWLDVKWDETDSKYDPKKVGSYTLKGKIEARDWIVNTRNIQATAKVTVKDMSVPNWPSNASISYDNRTHNSARLLWTEAQDDSAIKEYVIEAFAASAPQRTVRVPVARAVRMSNNPSDRNYNTLSYNITGLQPSTRYNIRITAIDSQNKMTQTSLTTSFTTTARASTSTSGSKSSQNRSNRPSDSLPDVYFDDLVGYSWAEPAIYDLVERNVINGTSSRTFSPGEMITRADLVVILVRALDLRASIMQEPFNDVPKSTYYYTSVMIAKELGIIKGDLKGDFFPEQPITREDIFVIVKRALDVAEIPLANRGYDAQRYYDYYTVADYAKQAVGDLVAAGLVKGSGSFLYPKNYATRAEAAVLVSQIY